MFETVVPDELFFNTSACCLTAVFDWTLRFFTTYYLMLLLTFEPQFLEPCPLSSPYKSSPLPPSVSLPFVPVWIFHITDAAGAWCEGLSAHCVYTVWVQRYATPRRVVCRDRRVAADASQPPACLSVFLFSYTWPTPHPPNSLTHTRIETFTYTVQHYSYGAQKSNYVSSTLHYCPLIPLVQEVDMRPRCCLWCFADLLCHVIGLQKNLRNLM